MRRGNNESVGDGNYHYHYNREERLALSPRLREALECGEKRKRGFLSLVLRGNRGMVFLLVDVAILLVLFLIYSILMAGGDALWNKDGYSFRLSAHAHGDKVLVALRITRRGWDRGEADPPTVAFLSGETSRPAAVPEMPTRRDESVYLRDVLPLPRTARVQALVEFGKAKKKMSAPVKEE